MIYKNLYERDQGFYFNTNYIIKMFTQYQYVFKIIGSGTEKWRVFKPFT